MIIDRYMVREVGVPFIAVSAVLVIIFSSYSLTRYLVDANAGLLLPVEVMQLTALRSLVSLEVLLPLSFYLAIMIGMGRLYSDSEVYAMRSSGISERRMMRPVMWFAVALAGLIAVLSLSVRPWAYATSYQIRAQAASTSEVLRIKPAQFYRFGNQDKTVFIDRVAENGNDVGGIFVRTRKQQDLQVITAATGTLEYDARPGWHRLTLRDARLYKRVEKAPDLFASLGSFALWMPATEVEEVGYKTKARSSAELSLARDPVDRAELQWRFSTPLSALLLALLAIPLSRGRPRQGRYSRILLALVIYAVYFNFLDVSRTWVEQGTSRSIWWVPVCMLGLLLIMYVPGSKWVRTRRSRRPT